MNAAPLLLAGLVMLMPAARSSAALNAGAAMVMITPPAGVGMAGYYHFRAADGVLDDLYARALVLEDGGTRAALITLDLISAPRGLVESVRAEIDKSGALPGAHVMISATHAHTGPVLASEGLPRLPGNPDTSGGADSPAAAYLRGLPALIASSVTQAAGRLQPVQATIVSGPCDGLAYCRRFYMRDGKVGWNPGKLNPDKMTATAPVDPQVQALFLTKPHAPARHVPAMAIYANFSMHPDTVGGTKFSADYPGALARRMADYHGADCITLYGNGTCGNLNHVDTDWAREQKGIEEANRIGTLLAAAIFRAEKSGRTIAGPLRVKSVTVPLDVPFVPEDQIERARATVKSSNDGDRRGFMELVHANRLLDLAKYGGRPIPAEVQVIALGTEAAWVGLPGEVFVELGLALKKRSPFPNTMIITLANSSPSYIPDRRSYAEGNYEPESARVEPGSGEKLVEAAAVLLTELHAGK